MLKKITLFLGFLLLSENIYILSAQQQVIATAGGEGTVNGVNLQWTLGECVIAETDTQNTVRLTQGFQQPAYSVEIIDTTSDPVETTLFSGRLAVYPMPATDYLTIEFATETQVNFVVTLTDITGKALVREELSGSENRIDMQSFPAAVYVLTIFENDGKFIKSFKVTKQ